MLSIYVPDSLRSANIRRSSPTAYKLGTAKASTPDPEKFAGISCHRRTRSTETLRVRNRLRGEGRPKLTASIVLSFGHLGRIFC